MYSFITYTRVSVLLENRPLIKFIQNYIQDTSLWHILHILTGEDIDGVTFRFNCCLCKNTLLYNKKKITRLLEDMNFIFNFSW